MITRFASLSGRLLVACSILFMVAACGGGGGGGSFLPDDDVSTRVNITTAELPPASAGTDYTALVQADGGKAPYAWAVIEDGGTGFTISSQGFITGKAPGKGSYGMTIRVTDANNRTADFSTILTVDIGPDSLAIATTALPNAIDGIQYSALVEAAGGKEPYTWAIVDDGGTGFTINDGGFLAGIAPEGGDYGLTIDVTDSNDTTARRSLTLTVTGDDTPQPLAIATSALPNAEEGKGYTAIFEAVGGQGDYQWTLLSSGGSGLQLRPDGLLSGTAPAKGQYAITVSVQDDTRTVTSIVQLTVAADSDPLTITTASLPGGTVKERYAAALAAVGGNPPYVWTLVSNGGSGLTLSANGVLSGVPTVPGTFGLVFRVSDGKTNTQSALTLAISTGEESEVTALTITTATLPNADRVLYAAALKATGGVPPYVWSGGDTGSPGTGFTVDPTSGAISGNTNDLLPGQYGYRVSVTDSALARDTRSYVITIPGGDTPPVKILTDNPLPNATVGLTYSVVMRAVGGSGTNTWQILETIPTGGPEPTFSSPGSADSGILFWNSTDIVAGDYLVTIQVTSADADSSADVVTFNLKAVAP